MQIRRKQGVRLVPGTATEYFRSHPEKWLALNNGETVTMSRKDWLSVEEMYAPVVEIVGEGRTETAEIEAEQ